MTVINPTHSCFDDAMEFIEQRINAAQADYRRHVDTLHIVHAICRFPDDNPEKPGHLFVHGWVEERQDNDRVLVWQAGIVDGGMRVTFSAERDEWYEHMRVQHRTAYTLLEVRNQNRQSGHYGPWLPMYRSMIARHEERRKREQSAPHASPKLRSL